MFGEYGPDLIYVGCALGYGAFVWIVLSLRLSHRLPLYPPPRCREFEATVRERQEF